MKTVHYTEYIYRLSIVLTHTHTRPNYTPSPLNLHSRYVFSRKGVCCVWDEHTSLSHRPIPHHHTFYVPFCFCHPIEQRGTVYSIQHIAWCHTNSFTLRSKSMLQILYSGKFSLVHNFAEMDPDSSEEIFIFAKWICDALTTPLPVDGHAPHTNWRNDTEWRSKEASLCTNDLVFFTYGGLCNYDSIRTAAMGGKLAQNCWSQLWQLQSIS